MTLHWTKEDDPRWDAAKQRLLGPDEQSAVGLAPPAPGAPVKPITRVRASGGRRSLDAERARGSPFSTHEITRASARLSPARTWAAISPVLRSPVLKSLAFSGRSLRLAAAAPSPGRRRRTARPRRARRRGGAART